MERFEKRMSLAGTLQPGDRTKYEMVAVHMWDCVEVIVQNDTFFDKIVFLDGREEVYHTHRGESTNPWTIKAAKEMRDRLLKNDLACPFCNEDDFDAIGLKIHLIRWCKKYKKTDEGGR